MWYPLARIEEAIMASVALAGVFVFVCMMIVLIVRSIPNKLILLGLLMTVAAILSGAFLPGAGTVAVVLIILGVIVVLSGVFCIVVSFIAQLFKGSSANRNKAE